MTLEDDLARLEGQVLGIRKVSSFLSAVEAIRRLLEPYPDEARKRILALTAPSLGGELAAAVLVAFGFGASDAARAAGVRPSTAEPTKVLISASTTAGRDIAKLVGQARTLIKGGAELDVALSPLLGAASKVKRDVTTLVNSAGNAGVVESARLAKADVVWVAETNACVHCLAYSGQVVAAGKAFPQGLSYLESNPYDAPGKHPPLHPHCRCTLEVLNELSYADALRREADRSVLRGFSLESESMRTRVAAAERLLERGVDAPKSVIKFAERSVAAGKFETRGRPQPTKPTPTKPTPTKPTPTSKAKPSASASSRSAQPTPQAQAAIARDLESPKPIDTPTTKSQNRDVPKTDRPRPQGKDFRSMTNAERLEAARIMYGANSPQYKAAKKRWG